MNNDSIKQFIEREIEKIPDLYSPMVYDSGDVWMFCPFHDPEHIHQAVKRTLKINLSNPEFPYGTFVCFACYGETPVEQAGKGNWNKLANKLGLKPLSPSEMYNDRPREISKEVKSKLGIKEEVKERIDVVINDVATVKWHANENWRTIKGMLLRKLDARKGINEKTEELILILPVVMHEYVIGKIFCRLKKEKGKISYINSPGKWSGKALFPYDYVARKFVHLNYVVIVEGPRDALKFIQNGIPALALLGSATKWNDKHIKSINKLGKKYIIGGLDGDAVGRKAYKKIKKSMKEHAIIKRIPFEDGQDPASLKNSEIKALAAKLKRLTKS